MLSIGAFARLGHVSPRTLRHYAAVGVLEPSYIDGATGYRYYTLDRLPDPRRVLALRDLGVTLEQIAVLTKGDAGVSVEQMRGMLRLREAEIATEITEQQDRLRRVAMYLDALESGDLMRTLDIIAKTSEPVRLAETNGLAPGYGYDNIHPVFQARLAVVWERLKVAGVDPGICVAHYDWPDDDGNVLVHLGFEIGDQVLTDQDDVRVVELPAVEVASALHRGSLGDIAETFEALARWIDSNGYRISDRSRELYLEANRDDPGRNVTELQLPITQQSINTT